MPSIEENRARVKESLDQSADVVDHDAILASLQDEIDRHNQAKDDLRHKMCQSRHRSQRSAEDAIPRSTRFRFKDGVREPQRKRPHRQHHHDGRKRRKGDYPSPLEGEAAHPFPREPTEHLRQDVSNTQHAFRESLFDALADDEGANYWEGVYSQPIHVYERPTVRTEAGELEQMGDDEYVDYVKARMWEKKHPEIVIERQRRARKKEEEEELKWRRRKKFEREREREAWSKSQEEGEEKSDDEEGQYEHTVLQASDFVRASERRKEEVWKVAWTNYLQAWETVKRQLLNVAVEDNALGKSDAAQLIPWPVLPGKTVVKANIEAFMQHLPAADGENTMRLLKAERVRWHPDKIQQRFGRTVEEGTMKLVTGVFQVVDAIVEGERGRVGR